MLVWCTPDQEAEGGPAPQSPGEFGKGQSQALHESVTFTQTSRAGQDEHSITALIAPASIWQGGEKWMRESWQHISGVA